MAKKVALGKGIASLISSTSNPVVGQNLKSKMDIEEKSSAVAEGVASLVDINQIKTNPNQPRKIFKEKELEELSLSIKENGIIQPLIVAKMEGGSFELVAGERRLRAAKKANLEKVPVVVKRATDREKMVMSIIENVQRSDLNCVEEALAYFQLMEEYKLTQEEVAKKLGKERSSIANYLRVLKLPRTVIELLQKEELAFGHAKVLASVKERDSAIRYATAAVKDQLSVRELEKLIKTARRSNKASEPNPFFDAKLDQFRQKLEKKTGFHFAINSKKAGNGTISLKYTNEAEFNDIYEYLLNL
jgi:ParB family chromosome partitioning protein